MKRKQTVWTCVVVGLVASIALVGCSPVVFADPSTTTVKCKNGESVTASRKSNAFQLSDYEEACKDKGGYEPPGTTNPPTPPTPSGTKKLECAILPQFICDAATTPSLQGSGTWLLLKFVLSILTAGVGIVAVGAIGYAGFLYATAQDSAEQTKKAKEMIMNVVIGIVAYGLMYVGLNFLIPGGVFSI